MLFLVKSQGLSQFAQMIPTSIPFDAKQKSHNISHTHRIHGAAILIVTLIKGFFVDGIYGTPYIAAPWILWDKIPLLFVTTGLRATTGCPKRGPGDREGRMSWLRTCSVGVRGGAGSADASGGRRKNGPRQVRTAWWAPKG